MRLRNLFEEKVSEVAIIFGRFNPPHKGHKAAWETAATKDEWYVGTNESTVGPKDPLPFNVKVEAMETIWPDVAEHIVAETSWLTLASQVYKKHGAVKLICVTDEEWVVPTVQEYNGKAGAHGEYNFPEIRLFHDSIEEAKLELRKSSATSLRDAVAKGDRQSFSDAAGVSAETPVMGKPFFDLVAEYLLPYVEKAKAKADKTKKKPDNTDKEKTPKVRDRKTGKEYNPDEEFDKLKNSPEFQAQMKRMAQKESVVEMRDKRDAYQRDYDHSTAGMDKHQSYAYQQDGGANDEGDDESFLRAQQEKERGPWYLRIDGKVLRDEGELKVFDWKKSANSYALDILKNKPELQGKVMLTKSTEDK
jgi:hypothetical protein